MSNFTILTLFPVSVYLTNIGDNQDAKEFIKQLPYNRLSSDNGYKTIDSHVLDNLELKPLRDAILKQVEFYTKTQLEITDNIAFEFANSWVIKHKKGDRAHKHMHVNSVLSGVLYIDVDENSGKLLLEKEYGYQNLFPTALDIDFNKFNMYNSRHWGYLPNVNDLLIFPSFLNHSVEENKSDNDRYCLAFNLFPRGNLGISDSEGFSQLTLK